jgi:two-component system phosphate regulon sensor histidine kinase PhoR
MKKVKLSALLMLCFALVSLFQVYWLRKLYTDEWKSLRKEIDLLLRITVQDLQSKALHINPGFFKPDTPNKFMEANMAEGRNPMPPFFGRPFPDSIKRPIKVSVQLKKNGDTISTVFVKNKENIEIFPPDRKDTAERVKYKMIFSKIVALTDSIPLKKVDSAYRKRLEENKIKLDFQLQLFQQNEVHAGKGAEKMTTGYAELGFDSPYAYKAIFSNPTWYILQKLLWPITFSIFIIIITGITLYYLFKNLQQQQKLSDIKDDFISNMTHELKTPIATVQVAIEALRDFGGIDDPQKAREYLNISAAELQRLSLLVDKVLRLSMFEKTALVLNRENFNLQQLVKEVMLTMHLQFQKYQARVTLIPEGDDFNVFADKLHITSVLYNLLDNALKYCKQHPEITIKLITHSHTVEVLVSDNGTGIEEAYLQKIFEKFFRVPDHGHHNVKGYGLGLSYVAAVLKQHNSSISCKSQSGAGTVFQFQIPKYEH